MKAVLKIIICLIVALLFLLILFRVITHDIMSGDMTDKSDIIEIVQENREVINNAVYTIYSNNIVGIYDTEERELPENVNGIKGKYIIKDTGERDIYSSPIYSYESLTDESLIAMLDIDELKSVRIDETIITLDFGGRGIVSSGACSGVYYFPNDDIADAKSRYNVDFKQSDTGWLCNPETGYNSFYVERICENLWYYEERW